MTDPRGIPWSDAEVTALLREYPLHGVAGVIPHVPQRSAQAIRLKALRSGIRRRPLTLADINARLTVCRECGATHNDPCTYALCPRRVRA